MMKTNKILFCVFILAVSMWLVACGDKSASDYYKEGIAYLESQEFELATQHLAEAVKKNPHRSEYYRDYAFALLETGNIEDALIQFDKGVLDKDNQIVSVKQTFQIDSTEADVLLIYKEHYEKQLSEYAADEKVKTSIVETETGLLVTLEFDVKNISPSSKDGLMELLDVVSLDAEALLAQMITEWPLT